MTPYTRSAPRVSPANAVFAQSADSTARASLYPVNGRSGRSAPGGLFSRPGRPEGPGNLSLGNGDTGVP